MNVLFTNYDGDPNALCSFCGREQHTHFIDAGSVDGQCYAHHFPCDEQMKTLGADTVVRKKRLLGFLEQWFPSKAA